MDPVTLSTVALVSTAVSGAVGAVGAISSGIAQSNAAKYNAAVARNNEIIAQQNAARAAAAGRAQAQAQDFRNAGRLGAIVAAEGASGIDMNSGSSREVRESAAQLGRLDTATIMDNAEQQVRGYNTQASNFEASSRLDQYTASNAMTSGFLNATGSVLGSASSFATKWASFKLQGLDPAEAF